MTDEVLGPRPSGPASLRMLISLVCGGVLVLAVVALLSGGRVGAAVGLPALGSLAMSSAWLAAYLLGARARVLDDEQLRWVAWGYALMGLIVLALALGTPGFANPGVRSSLGSTPSGNAALRLLVHLTAAGFVLGALLDAGRSRLLRRAAIVGVLMLTAATMWQPSWGPFPELVTSTGAYTSWHRALIMIVLTVTAGALLAWVARCETRPNWTQTWIAIGLAALLATLLVSAFTTEVLSVSWWSAVVIFVAAMVAPAAGLLADLPRQLHHLHQHAVGLQTLLDHELELAATEHTDAAVAAEQVQAVLDSGAFGPVFQPIMRLDTLQAVGTEALTRFTGETAAPPNLWFDRARRAGMSLELEMATARTALSHLSSVPDGLYVSVNLSPATIRERLMGEILKVVPAHRLVVEVTEHEAIDNYDELNDALRELRRLGVRLAVDDAGAGFSSFRHIVRTQPDIIKLDVSLVRDMDIDPVRRALTASLVTFAGQIGATIVAEGIETREELDAVRDLGVEFGQGYYLARPGPVEHLLQIGVDVAQPSSG